MRIDALALRNFRNYDALNVTFAPDCNVIVGENAQGKTNLLEAIVYLSSARSPRARAEKELISFGKSECSIKANAFARNRDFLLEIALAAGRRRKILINKVPVKKGSDLSDVLGAVYFCPEDLLLIRDGAAARRKFMDDALCQLRARYAQALSDYHRAYEHKTRILRDSEEYPSLLDTLPEFDLRMAAERSGHHLLPCAVLRAIEGICGHRAPRMLRRQGRAGRRIPDGFDHFRPARAN